MRRLIFLDIDGTLAYPGQAPSNLTVAAIRNVRSNGHKVFLSTGRTMDSIPLAVSSIGFDGGVFSSGGVIVLDNKVIFQHFMQNDIAQKVIMTLKRMNMFYTLETADGRFNSENTNEFLSQADFSNTSKEMRQLTASVICDSTAIPMSQYAGQPIHKIAYYSTNWSITAQLQSELRTVAKVVPFNNIPGFPLASGEVSDYSVNKGRALNDICKHFGVSPSVCIAFGDSLNDAEILDAAGTGIAMGNAEPELKELADMICDRCENDGIAKALAQFNLI